MADYPLAHGEHKDIMASKMYKNKFYIKWVMGLSNSTGPSSSTGSTSSPAAPHPPPRSHPRPPEPSTAAPPSPAPSGADPSLLRKLNRLERKLDALTVLARCLVTGEEPPSATDVNPGDTREVPEASTIATLA